MLKLQYLGPCQPGRGSGLNSQFLALVWPSSDYSGHLKSETEGRKMESLLSLSLSLALLNNFYDFSEHISEGYFFLIHPAHEFIMKSLKEHGQEQKKKKKQTDELENFSIFSGTDEI